MGKYFRPESGRITKNEAAQAQLNHWRTSFANVLKESQERQAKIDRLREGLTTALNEWKMWMDRIDDGDDSGSDNDDRKLWHKVRASLDALETEK